MKIEPADRTDLPDILALQKRAYLTEAELTGNYAIQPLTQTLPQVEQEYEKGVFLKVNHPEAPGTIIASVRAFSQGNTAFVGKLMVHPDFRRQGLGASLLKKIETYFPGHRFELFTSSLSVNNITLYKKQGYAEFRTETTPSGLTLVYMEKIPL